jgi:hypothetical protein
VEDMEAFARLVTALRPWLAHYGLGEEDDGFYAEFLTPLVGSEAHSGRAVAMLPRLAVVPAAGPPLALAAAANRARPGTLDRGAAAHEACHQGPSERVFACRRVSGCVIALG